MKKLFKIVLVCLIVIGSGLLIKNSFSEKENKNETVASVEPVVLPELFLETEVLDPEETTEEQATINQLYEGDVTFEHFDPTKNYVLSVRFVDANEFVFAGPDQKPLTLEKELVLGKENGKVHVRVTGTKPMVDHIQKLNDVRVAVEMGEKNK